MNYLKVPAQNGFAWARQAVLFFAKNPFVFIPIASFFTLFLLVAMFVLSFALRFPPAVLIVLNILILGLVLGFMKGVGNLNKGNGMRISDLLYAIDIKKETKIELVKLSISYSLVTLIVWRLFNYKVA